MPTPARLALLALLPLAACDAKGDADTGATDGDDTTAEDAAMAEALWDEAAGYDGWPQVDGWTGVASSADGTHGAFVQIWINEAADGAITAAAGGEMPDGAILVKEGYDDEAGSSVRAVTMMKKVAGYDAAHGDWFFARYGADGTLTAVGQAAVDGCAGCHSSGQDYVRFTTW